MESWGGHTYMIMVSQKVPTCSKNMFQITLWWTKTSFRVREILRGDFYFSQWSRTYGDNNKILYSISSVLDWWSLKPKWSYYWSYRLISNHRYKPLKKNTNFFLNERASVNISRDDWSGCLKGSEGIFSFFFFFFANHSVHGPICLRTQAYKFSPYKRFRKPFLY